jgi:hypothetical protein
LNIQARIGNIMAAMQADEAREARKKQWEEEKAQQQAQSHS